MEQRYGTFSISHDMIDNMIDNDIIINAVFDRVLVLMAESDYCSDSINYTAYSTLFDVIDEGVMPKRYIPIITKIETDSVFKDEEDYIPAYSYSVEWKEVE